MDSVLRVESAQVGVSASEVVRRGAERKDVRAGDPDKHTQENTKLAHQCREAKAAEAPNGNSRKDQAQGQAPTYTSAIETATMF